MNYWTDLSIKFANERDYLDNLYKVYPMSKNFLREIDINLENNIRKAFYARDNKELLKNCLKLELFPLKDSYVSYLRRDMSALDRNPKTVNRLASMLYENGFEDLIKEATRPKETNRQMGPLFKRWIDMGNLGFIVTNSVDKFKKTDEDMILNCSDDKMKTFCKENLGYKRLKGIDFLARISQKYIVAEAKFLTDFGGHQNAQLADALATMKSPLAYTGKEVIRISILDGVCYIKNSGKMYKEITSNDDDIILSSLVLRDFLYSI